jgi:hypothetical protein
MPSPTLRDAKWFQTCPQSSARLRVSDEMVSRNAFRYFAKQEGPFRGIAVLQKVSLFRETIHCFAISPFNETSRFTCFAKNRDAKQAKRFAKRPPYSHVSLFRDTETSYFVKDPCLVAWSHPQLLYFASVSRKVPYFAVSQNVSWYVLAMFFAKRAKNFTK